LLSAVGESMESLTVILVIAAVVAAEVWWIVYLQQQKENREWWRYQPETTQPVDEQQRKQVAVTGQQILDRNSDIVHKFLEIAERKVSVLDDYGDERMHLLGKEVDECIAKLATREGNPVATVYAKRNDKLSPVPLDYAPWRWAYLRLRQLFTEYHELQKNKVRTLKEIDSLSGAEFESYVARILQKSGWHVSGTPATGDQGADLIASKGNRKIAIQVKRYTSSVGNSAVQEAVGAVRFYGANEGCVITNSSFTPSARSLAQKNDIRLIEGSNLDELESI
jgi:restriction endonuclease Mrr